MSTSCIQQQEQQQRPHCKSFRVLSATWLKTNKRLDHRLLKSNEFQIPSSLSRNKDLDYDVQCSGLQENSNRVHGSRKPVNDEASEDLTVYQGGDLYGFFKETGVPKHVSEICLVNDNYILVKMPDEYWMEKESQTGLEKQRGTLEAQIHKTDEIMGSTVAIMPGKQDACFGRKISTFLNCHGNHSRVSPARDDGSNQKATSSAIANGRKSLHSQCWTDNNANSNRGDAERPGTSKKHKPKLQRCKRVDFVCESNQSRISSCHLEDLEADPDDGVEQVREFTNSSSNMTNVTLESKGILEIPTISKSSNDICIETYPEHEANVMKQKLMFASRRNSFKWSFNWWFLKPFRSRKSKSKNPSSQRKKIHAVVCKTYFVRWTKPPDSPNAPSDKMKLRRSHSAVF